LIYCSRLQIAAPQASPEQVQVTAQGGQRSAVAPTFSRLPPPQSTDRLPLLLKAADGSGAFLVAPCCWQPEVGPRPKEKGPYQVEQRRPSDHYHGPG
jgi:hypothetical protein